MDFTHLTSHQWLLAILSALAVGLTKGGFNGVGMLITTLMAAMMPGHERESTGVVLPLLVAGDVLAILAFWRHIQWRVVLRLMPPALLGIVAGYFWLCHISDAGIKPLIGGIVLALIALQLWRQRGKNEPHVPHQHLAAWTMGAGAGVTTMLANAAGPVVTLYFLAMRMPKLEFVANAAGFFLAVNLSKLPFSAHLGFIRPETLCFNAMLVPFVALGLLGGKWLVHRIHQTHFDALLLALTAASAVWLVFS